MRVQLNKVAGYRAMLGLKQRDIAAKLNISSQSYSNKENGKNNFNDQEKIILKKLFSQIDKNLTIDDIFFYK